MSKTEDEIIDEALNSVGFKDGKQWQGFEVTGDNGEFSTSGDSGSAIITVSKPHKIVGILSAGDGSNMPEDIKSKLGL